MAYRPPSPFVQRVFNPLALRFGIAGAQKLSVPRRRTGDRQEIPVMPVEHQGGRYLVSVRGESEWVRNLRAAGGHADLDGTPIATTEIPPDERPAIVELYRKKAGRGVASHFDALPAPEDHPVFRIGAA